MSLSPVGDAFENGQVIEQVPGGDSGIDPKFLREVAELFANAVGLLDDVDTVEENTSFVRLLQAGQGSHE